MKQSAMEKSRLCVDSLKLIEPVNETVVTPFESNMLPQAVLPLLVGSRSYADRGLIPNAPAIYQLRGLCPTVYM